MAILGITYTTWSGPYVTLNYDSGTMLAQNLVVTNPLSLSALITLNNPVGTQVAALTLQPGQSQTVDLTALHHVVDPTKLAPAGWSVAVSAPAP